MLPVAPLRYAIWRGCWPRLSGLGLEFLFYLVTMNLITSFNHKYGVDTEPAVCAYILCMHATNRSVYYCRVTVEKLIVAVLVSKLPGV